MSNLIAKNDKFYAILSERDGRLPDTCLLIIKEEGVLIIKSPFFLLYFTQIHLLSLIFRPIHLFVTYFRPIHLFVTYLSLILPLYTSSSLICY